tara:strand:+ start:671 stop:1462 length:792 start_codon:yes stop_codon:yes gene_type:complete
MNIIDCFLYNNEDLILELRLNLLDKHVDKFVIIEAKYNHSGAIKKNYSFNLENFKKFKDKITYLRVEDFPNSFNPWERENYHRNYILKALENIHQEDYIIISDIDEIPNLDSINQVLADKRKYTAFKQKMIYYKFNLLNASEPNWYGSKMCKFKNLKNPQWLRQQKVKNYPFYRLDKIKWNIVDKGGWHFSFVMHPEDISKKIKSFAHSEFNKTKFTNINQISEKINSHKDLFGRDFRFEVIKDEELPNYVIENREKFSDFLV